MITSLRSLKRLSVIVYVVLRYDLDGVLPRQPWWWSVCSGCLALWPARRRWRLESYGLRLRLALIDLGPIFIKLGQALSTRYDLLPFDVAEELAKLQDQVPPIAGGWGRACTQALLFDLHKHKGLTPVDVFEQTFTSFDDVPLAAASIAQVHAAVLQSGERVVVKLLRPDVHAQVSRDVCWMRWLARWGECLSARGKRLRLMDVVEEFARFTHDELDLRREAANASQMRRLFLHSDILSIPQVHWSLCGAGMMVMDRIEGVPIGDVEALQSHGVDMRRLAERGVEIFFTQVLRDRFFHADMHPGNIFIDVRDPLQPKYIAIDFGIVGALTVEDQRYLAENIMAFFKQDYARVAQLHVDAGWVPKHIDVLAFEFLIRTVCEPMFEQPLSQISFGGLLFELLQAAQQFEMVVQPQLLLLQKTLLSIEGLGRRLYPDLDLWSTAKPILEKWLKEQVGVKALLKQLKARGPFVGLRLLESLLAHVEVK